MKANTEVLLSKKAGFARRFSMRDLYGYSLLLITSLGIAWWASTPRSLTDGDAIRLTSINPASIQKLTYRKGTAGFTAVRREGDGRFWIESDGNRFLAGDRFAETLGFFKPLEAKRLVSEVAQLDDAKLKTFGLSPATARIEIETSDEPSSIIKLELGTNSFGTTDRYGFTLDGKRVVLFDADMISGFDSPAARFFDRTILGPAKITEADAAEIEKGPNSKRFARAEKKAGNSEHAPFEGAFADWLEKYEKLRAIRFADTAIEEKLSTLQPKLVLKLLKGDASICELALRNFENEWWVFSSELKAHVEISANRAEPVIKDAESLF
jgi:hypothetical protein